MARDDHVLHGVTSHTACCNNWRLIHYCFNSQQLSYHQTEDMKLGCISSLHPLLFHRSICPFLSPMLCYLSNSLEICRTPHRRRTHFGAFWGLKTHFMLYFCVIFCIRIPSAIECVVPKLNDRALGDVFSLCPADMVEMNTIKHVL